MVQRALALLLTTAATLAGPTTAHAAAEKKPTPKGELRVCGEGAPMDVYIDRDELHKEKRGLSAGECKDFALPKGKYAVTVIAACTSNQDAKLADITVAPASRALYRSGALAGARVVRKSTTTFTATWTCVGIGGTAPDATAPPTFGEPSPPTTP